MGLVILRFSLGAFSSRRTLSEVESRGRERERSRLSEDLHDNVKQNTYGLEMLLDSYREARSNPRGEGDEERLLEQAIEASKEASYRIGQPVHELRANLRECDAKIALERLAAEIRRYSTLEVRLVVRDGFENLDHESLGVSYRVVGESLWNAARHSGAREVRVRLLDSGSHKTIEVLDEGQGFGPDSTSRGSGLELIRERVKEVGGELEVRSQAGAGTVVRARFPAE